MTEYTREQMAIFRNPETEHWEEQAYWFTYESSAIAAGWGEHDTRPTGSYPCFWHPEHGSWYPNGMDARKWVGIPATREPNFIDIFDWSELCRAWAIKPSINPDIPAALKPVAEEMLLTGAWR